MKAVVLAAGEGKRLRPLTETRPKSMIPVAGKPLLHHLLLEAKKAGITEAVIVVKNGKEQIMNYFNAYVIGMKITFVEQGEENGTGAALLAAKDEIKDTFVMLAGDIVTEASVIRKVIEGHNGKITLAVKKVPNPREYGVVELSNGKVSIFEEKPTHPKTDLANLSILCMEPTVFGELKSLGKSERGEHELVDLFIGATAVEVDGFWRDIGYPWDLFDALEFMLSNMESKSGKIENSTIIGKVVMEEGAQIIDSYVEGNVYVGANTVIGPYAVIRGNCSFGKNCSVGGGSSVKNSVLMDNVNAKHLAYIGDSVLGENVNIGSGTQLANFRFDSGFINVLTSKGWANSGRKKLGVFVGDHTKFGVNSCTMPGKLIGPGCWIYSGVVVNRNVPANTKVYYRQQVEFGKFDEG